MFQKARFKLTAWYLLIIFIISITFSGLIFRVQMQEVERFARAQRIRIEKQFPERPFNPQEPPFIDIDLVKETQNRLFINLLLLNGIIIAISGGLGYVLAGKTLKPIKEVMDDQDRFVSDSSHELRTPLTSLKSAMEVALMDKKLTISEAKKIIKENINDINQLQKLSDSLIKLSKSKEQKNNIIKENVSLSEVINTAIEKIKPQAKQKDIIIKKRINNYIVKGDKEMLISMFVSIMDNALKYSPTKKSIIVKTLKTEKNISVSIKDYGKGIEKKDLSHIFDRFYRADTARTKSSVSGFGLGLSIAKMIVEKHHGTIKVKSTLGRGSTFTVKIPK